MCKGKRKHQLDRPHKVAVERGLNAVALSLSVVMAGSGNLDALRILRYFPSPFEGSDWKNKPRALRLRLGPEITYGNHMAIGMAIGLLFMGGGVYTLSTSNIGIAGNIGNISDDYNLISYFYCNNRSYSFLISNFPLSQQWQSVPLTGITSSLCAGGWTSVPNCTGCGHACCMLLTHWSCAESINRSK